MGKQIGQLWLLVSGQKLSRMEIASSLEEKIVISRKQEEQRNNVIDFDFLFEFSPERQSTEPRIHFEQDQSGQGGEQQQQQQQQREQREQREGSGGRNRRAEVRPYPSSEMRSTNKLEKSRQSARECRARKKLRYQYLDDMILEREKANDALREELAKYVGWCQMLDQSQVPDGLQELLTTTPESWK